MMAVSAWVLGLLASTCSAMVARESNIFCRQGPAYSPLGCYTEGAGVRALATFNYVNHTSMTVEVCATLCASKYNLFGLEYGEECWCANVFGKGSVQTSAAECSFPCAGNSTEKCGAGNRLNVYSTTPTPPVAPAHVVTAGNYTRIGCYTEGNGTRALSGAQENDYAGLAVEKCASFCANQTYSIMGVEYGGECYCGNQAQFATSGSTLAPDSDCNMLCAGSPAEYCGAGNRIDTYRAEAPPRA